MSSNAFPPIEPSQQAVTYEAPRTGLAIAALVCGIVGLLSCVPSAIAGLVMGIIALVNSSQQPDRYGGRGMAIGGIVTGAVGLLLIPLLMISILLPSLSRARELAKRAVCSANLRGVGQSVQIYVFDNGGAPPPDLQTLVNLGLLTPKQLVNPSSGHADGAIDFYYVAETPPAKSAPAELAGWIVAYSDPQFHRGEGASVLYADSHVEFLKAPRFSAELERFKAAFQKARGMPPRIIPPK